jgi:hypothetical protein
MPGPAGNRISVSCITFMKVKKRAILRNKREEVTGGWKKVHKEEIRNLHSIQNIISVIKARMVGWTANTILL